MGVQNSELQTRLVERIKKLSTRFDQFSTKFDVLNTSQVSKSDVLLRRISALQTSVIQQRMDLRDQKDLLERQRSQMTVQTEFFRRCLDDLQSHRSFLSKFASKIDRCEKSLHQVKTVGEKSHELLKTQHSDHKVASSSRNSRKDRSTPYGTSVIFILLIVVLFVNILQLTTR